MEGVTRRRQTKSAAVVPPVRGPRGKPVESRRGPATVAGQPVPRSHSQACGEGGTARSARALQTREPGNLPGGAKRFHLFERKREPVPPSRAIQRCLVSSTLLAAAVARAQEPGETIEVRGERPEGSPRAPAAQATAI